jgi:hypothetical protein
MNCAPNGTWIVILDIRVSEISDTNIDNQTIHTRDDYYSWDGIRITDTDIKFG